MRIPSSIRLLLAKRLGQSSYLASTTWLLADQTIRLAIGLVVVVLVARYLGPTEFGKYSFAASVVVIVGTLATLGLESIVRRDLVEREEYQPEILGTCYMLTTLAGLLSYILLMFTVGALVVDREIGFLLLLFGASLLTSPFNLIDLWFHARAKGSLSFVASLSAFLCASIAKIFAVFVKADLIVFGYIFLLESIVVSSLRIILYESSCKAISNWRFNWTLGKRMLKEAWPLIASSLAIIIYMRIDQVMLGVLADKEDVGEYAAATQISTTIYFIPRVLAASFLPIIIRAKAKDSTQYQRSIQLSFDINAIFAYIVALPICLLSPFIANAVFGTEYTETARILSIHSLSAFFVFLGVARNQFFISESLFKVSLLLMVCGALSNICLNSVFIPIFQGEGAAVATLISYAVSAYFSSIFIAGGFPIFRMQTVALFPFLDTSRFREYARQIQR